MNKLPAKTFQDLLVWQKAHSFVLKMYSFTRQFPKDELFLALLLKLEERRYP
jgi:hypothetical protein